MIDIDVLAPNYRRVKEKWGDAALLSGGYAAILRCADGGGHGLLEHIKSFIESTCVTILAEFDRKLETGTPSATELLVAALKCFGFENSRGANNLDKLLSGFNKLSDALSDMRNEAGPVAHGKDGFLDAIDADQCRAFLHVGDAILSILLNAMEGKEPNLVVTREPYERFPHLNDRIDNSVAVQVKVDPDATPSMIVIKVASEQFGDEIELRVEPSRLLYGVDRSIYVEVLKSVGKIEVEAGADTIADASPAREERSEVSEIGDALD